MSTVAYFGGRLPRPMSDRENDIRSVVDFLLLAEQVLSATPGGLDKNEARALDRIVGDALARARRVEEAFDVAHGGAA